MAKRDRSPAPSAIQPPPGVGLLRIETDNLESPPLAGYADRFGAIDRGYSYEFVFFLSMGKEEGQLVCHVVISIDLLLQMWSASQVFCETNRDRLQAVGIKIEQVSDALPSLRESLPSPCSILRATAAPTLDTLLEFYHMSPRDVHLHFTKGKTLKFKPVLGVLTSLPVAVGWFGFLGSIQGEVKSRIGALVPG